MQSISFQVKLCQVIEEHRKKCIRITEKDALKTKAEIPVTTVGCLKKKLNAFRPSEHPKQGGEIPKRLVGGIIGC